MSGSTINLPFRDTADVSSESEDEIEVGTGPGKHDLVVKQETKPGFFKQNKKQQPLFSFVEEKIKWDDYGEIIRLDNSNFDIRKILCFLTEKALSD